LFLLLICGFFILIINYYFCIDHRPDSCACNGTAFVFGVYKHCGLGSIINMHSSGAALQDRPDKGNNFSSAGNGAHSWGRRRAGHHAL
jgi:hypothetical protein